MEPAAFLSAKWKHLIMINYEVDPSILAPYIPTGTQIDLWKGKALISLVGFMFLDTYVNGFSIPFHRDFEEVNLRFYVKKSDTAEGERRGVVFIKEIVPRWGIAFLARYLYNENYAALPMQHLIEQHAEKIRVEYSWKYKGRWQKIGVGCQGIPYIPLSGSEAEFITEHYWGYTIQQNGETLEYQVKHPPWRIWEVGHNEVAVDLKAFYGTVFTPSLEKPPVSAFLAEGSEVRIFKGRKVKF
jgi:uncharacterized protein